MNFADWLAQAKHALQQAGIANPLAEARYLLCRYLNMDTAYLLSHLDDALSDADTNNLAQNNLAEWLKKRYNFMPLAYICERVEFYETDFIIRQGVLIPRGDTETLLMLAGQIFTDKTAHLRVLELAAGSGALGLSMAKIYGNAQCVLSDISDDACNLVAENIDMLGLNARAQVVKSDWLADIDQQEFDMVLINPPYIKRDDIASLEKNVRDYEPHLALDGGADGMDCYRTLNQQLPEYIADGGVLILEIGAGQMEDVIKIMHDFDHQDGLEDAGGILRALAFAKKRSVPECSTDQV